MIDYSIWCFVLSFSSSNVLGNKYHNQKWRVPYFTRIKLEVRVLVCVRVIARIKLIRLKGWALCFHRFEHFACVAMYICIYIEREYIEKKRKRPFLKIFRLLPIKTIKGWYTYDVYENFPIFKTPDSPRPSMQGLFEPLIACGIRTQCPFWEMKCSFHN